MTAETARELHQPLPVLLDMDIEDLARWHAEAMKMREAG